MVENKRRNRGFMYSIIVYIAASYGLAYLGIAEGWSLYTNLLVSQGMVLIPVVGVLLCHKENPFRGIRWKVPPITSLPLVGIITICCYPLMALCNMITMLFTTNTASEISLQAVSGPVWLNFLFMAVIPALSEEFLFRGIYFHSYRRAGVWKGIFLSALLFGLMHMNVNQFSYALMLGILMALIIEATGSIWSSILVHLLINGFSVLVLWMEKELLGAEMLQESLESAAGTTITEQITTAELLPMIIVIAVVAAVGLVFAAAFYYLLAVVCKRNEYIKALFSGRVEPERKSRLLTVPLLIGMLLSAAYMLIFL